MARFLKCADRIDFVRIALFVWSCCHDHRREAGPDSGGANAVRRPFRNGKEAKLHFLADSNAAITKGTAALLCELYSGESPEDILSLEPDFLGEVGITQHLSPNRRNGLTNVRGKIKAYAELCLKNN